jgi:hypothetical protein
MIRLNSILLKTVRWSAWPLLAVLLLFLLTGYAMSGEFNLDRVMNEKNALTLHRMLHVPLIILTLAHGGSAMYLAVQRWGWFKRPRKP